MLYASGTSLGVDLFLTYACLLPVQPCICSQVREKNGTTAKSIRVCILCSS